MNPRVQKSQIERLKKAAQWHDRVRSNPGLRTEAEFHSWLATPENAEYFRRVTHTWAAVQSLADTPEIEALRRRARGRAVTIVEVYDTMLRYYTVGVRVRF